MFPNIGVKIYFNKYCRNHIQERTILLIILDILADTHGFEGDFARQIAIGMPGGDRNKFRAGCFVLDYTKSLK